MELNTFDAYEIADIYMLNLGDGYTIRSGMRGKTEWVDGGVLFVHARNTNLKFHSSTYSPRLQRHRVATFNEHLKNHNVDFFVEYDDDEDTLNVYGVINGESELLMDFDWLGEYLSFTRENC